MQANEIHDTDLVKPGDQTDMATPLAVPVNCHNIQMKTAGDLNVNTGPMDSLWMVSVDGGDTHPQFVSLTFQEAHSMLRVRLCR